MCSEEWNKRVLMKSGLVCCFSQITDSRGVFNIRSCSLQHVSWRFVIVTLVLMSTKVVSSHRLSDRWHTGCSICETPVVLHNPSNSCVKWVTGPDATHRSLVWIWGIHGMWWAVCLCHQSVQTSFFVVDTSRSVFTELLRQTESGSECRERVRAWWGTLRRRPERIVLPRVSPVHQTLSLKPRRHLCCGYHRKSLFCSKLIYVIKICLSQQTFLEKGDRQRSIVSRLNALSSVDKM